MLRTLTRIQNEPLFHPEADFVVYVEGGTNGNGAPAAARPVFDKRYWQMIFDLFSPDQRFYIKPVGSKIELRPIAEQLCTSRIPRTLVCMDRDYDHTRWLYRAPAVFYTYG